MEMEVLKQTAERCVAEGLRRASVLSGDAWRDRRLSEMMPNPEREALRNAAANKFQKAESIRQLCRRMANQHGIGKKATGRGWLPRPVMMKRVTVTERRITNAR